MKFQPLILSLALTFPLAVFGQTPASTNANDHLSTTDHHFLQKLGKEDQSEIDMAKLALKKSNDPQVRQYANSSLSADPNMEEQAKTIAQDSKRPIDANVTPQQKAEYDRLSKLSGHEFDRAYIDYEATRQHQDLDMVQHEINTTKDAQVKSFAQQEETPVRNAADLAKKTQPQVTHEMSAKK
jgi:putative membrane protein